MTPPAAVSTVMVVPRADVSAALVVRPLESYVPTYDAPEMNGVTAEMLVTLDMPVL
jgi:hypothetical protein